MLAQHQDGHRLQRLLQLSESESAALEGVTHTKVITRHDDKVLLVFDRKQQRWQLPGGAIEPGESGRACAVRELHEESSNSCFESELAFAFAFELLVGPTRFNAEERIELGLLYSVSIDHIAAFIPNEEIGATLWWPGTELSHELDAIDRRLIELFRERETAIAQAV